MATPLPLSRAAPPELTEMEVDMKSIGVRLFAVGALIGLYSWNPIAGVGALATVFGYIVARRVGV